ncbi:iron permease Fip1 [Schizosaccharomyces japonicus yFS275]|uniref:Iron permease Fip1 n=1 Tax=Schizosaccharomyces japonicus (strain yFS275 / FY16936) TaxID=402676 RepID=B6K7G5_SCHJY|nr:iron permease Fip1 [Schizosaccharomyces japonicus yFS275]EEB09469.1 iron permease Fip1 [Schizosaccharomyces japonicus yFS275]
MAKNVFSVAVFFIVLRETLEAAIIVSVLLSFIKQTLADENGKITDRKLFRKLFLHVWLGSAVAFLICLAIGGGFIGAFYALQKDLWGSSEEIWEGVFSLIAVILISIMGVAMLRVSHLQEKWRKKLMNSLANEKAKGIKGWTKKYSMFLLPFVTVLREGLEVVVFVGGVGLSTPATAFPLAVFCGLLVGAAIGYFIYKGGNVMNLQWFLIASTCILYLIAAGLMSKAVYYFEMYQWNKLTGGDASEQGSGPGSYDFRHAIWHVNYGNPELNDNGGWMIFNAIFGWNNTGTYGNILSYIFYWVILAIVLFYLSWRERRNRKRAADNEEVVGTTGTSSDSSPGVFVSEKKKEDISDEGSMTIVRIEQQAITHGSGEEIVDKQTDKVGETFTVVKRQTSN